MDELTINGIIQMMTNLVNHDKDDFLDVGFQLRADIQCKNTMDSTTILALIDITIDAAPAFWW